MLLFKRTILCVSSIIIQLSSADLLSLKITVPSSLVNLDLGLLDYSAELTKILKSSDVPKIGYESDVPEADLLEFNSGLLNEDKDLNSSQLITKYHYTLQEYEVETPDGYLLTMFRIKGDGPPCFLMHGLLCSSDDFLSSGPNNSLAFFLAQAGYDVWMGNARGNKYSRKHVSIPPCKNKFWYFSWHEIGVLDLPTMIDFILEKVDYEKLYYIGYSQGTTSSYVLLSEKPEYNKKIALLVSLSPVAWMNHLFSPVIRALVPFIDQEAMIFKLIGAYEFLPSDGFVSLLKSVLCGTSVLATAVCSNIVAPLFGFDYPQINFTLYSSQIGHTPAGSATRQLIHYAQLVDSGHFRQFDYGEDCNKNIYGSATPPDYDVSKIATEVALFYSTNDWLSSPIDVKRLASKLSNLKLLYKVPFPFNHVDYLWAKDAKALVYSKVLKTIEKGIKKRH